MLWWALAAAAVALGAIGAVLTAGEASAQAPALPGIGAIELPSEVQTPAVPEILTVVPDAVPVPDFAPDGIAVPDATDTSNGYSIRNGFSVPDAILPDQNSILNAIPFSSLTAVPDAVAPQDAFATETFGPAAHSIAAPLVESGTPGAPDPNSAVSGIVSAVQAAFPGFTLPPLPQLMFPAPPQQSAPPAPKTTGEVAVEAAESKLGSSYSYGSAGPDSFDCSGLVQWSYEQAGVELPRTSYEQLDAGTPVGMDDLQPGDLVSFYGGEHSALYAGDGKVVHAATSGTGVVMSPISDMPVSGARRF
ncbi:C40 family peptidase [Nocardia terpenica]|nr:C40 family peptidase [Nocardia terpenica]MBF6104228.1 C40 family peptidase [Nocardia terpenica]MBF6109916.1 C40 family peptidase [Nocardia terpenica]MBF6120222.1 C40 family peptidase [Nocardia terpenica]MBF6152633.1 C40 family peptidase [Nocardia terpenica]